MIVLGKDKTLDNYFIDENGVITDQFGNVQKTKIYQGRSYFKSVAVYQIQMWTNYGWRDTKIWAIHHLDENKENDSILNLTFLTHSEHAKLHMKGNKRNEETCKKISNSMKGKNHPFYGKHHSEEIKQKISKSMKGKHRSEETRKKMSDTNKGKHLSEETLKKISESKKGKHWFNDGSRNYFEYICPDDCKPGKLNKK